MLKIVYYIWFLFYMVLTWLMLGANLLSLYITLIIYCISLLVAFIAPVEALERFLLGARKLRTRREIDKLRPIYEIVEDNYISIRAEEEGRLEEREEYRRFFWTYYSTPSLYIKDTMDINAFAIDFLSIGLTKGAMHFFTDEELAGILAHELGHIKKGHTGANKMLSVGNIVFTLIFKVFEGINNALERFVRSFGGSDLIFLLWTPFNLLYKGIMFLGEIIIMPINRRNEYEADAYAFSLGLGENLIEALYKLEMLSTEEPMKITDYIRRTHPPLTCRIKKLEKQEAMFQHQNTKSKVEA